MPKERWVEDLIHVSEEAYRFLETHSITGENVVVTKSGFQSLLPSLDNNGQFSPTSQVSNSVYSWSKKQRRAYHCAISGLKRCQAKGYLAFFLTLTSSPKTNHPDLRKDWDIFVKRIRKLFPKFQYVKVETFEGYGVIHALYHHAFEGWSYAAIHDWISKAWAEIHQAPIVWNSVVNSGAVKRVSGYLCQYMSGQRGFFRRSTSQNWIFSSFRRKWKLLIDTYGFKTALAVWDNVLASTPFGAEEQVHLVVDVG